MTSTVTTPFRDPRNAVGLLTDVLDCVLAGPVLTSPLFTDHEALHPVVISRDLSREFAKASKAIFNGYRRTGTAAFYQRLKTALDKLPEDVWQWGDKKRELHATLRVLSSHGLEIAMLAMEDNKRWSAYTHAQTVRQYGQTTTVEPVWPRVWTDYVSGAQRLGADVTAIVDAECAWRFRDLTDRSHRGRNIKAAFEAAWLAGHHKFAMQLIEKGSR